MIEKILAVLPQTQCEKCGYKGCLPYAKAILEGAPNNLCAPGGQKVTNAIASITKTVPLKASPPKSSIAIIDEDLCIGCTKCIKVCPTDAIIGANKLMHTVLAQDCTGCELCVPACPMECIDLVATDVFDLDNPEDIAKAQYYKFLHDNKNARTSNIVKNSEKEHAQSIKTKEQRKAEIAEAIKRKKGF